MTETSLEITWVKPLAPLDDLPGHLLGAVKIGHGLFHVDAVEVVEEAEYWVPAAEDDTDGETFLDRIVDLCGDRPAPIEIDGKQYILAITPYGY